MPAATLTTKGQTTIPKQIPEHLGQRPGDRMRFSIDSDGRVVLEAATLSVRDLGGILPKPKRPVSLEEMGEAIRRRAAGR